MDGCQPEAVTRLVVDGARALGFHRVGVSAAAPAATHDRFVAWLEAGYAAGMAYMADPAAVRDRRDVRALCAAARSVVVVALSYGGPAAPAPPGRAVIARYARGGDYHMVMKRKLAELAERVAAGIGRPVISRACVDTAPVLERDLAERTGIGFVGKNTLLIAPGVGSNVLLGELLLDVDAAPTAEEPARKRCGACRACLDACPTGAFVDAFVLDARRCISYLTIEHTGAIPRELRPRMGAMVFGCDVCQDVCPFNAAEHAPAPELAPAREPPDLVALLDLGAARFRRFVERTALRRVHRAQFLRNVCVALGNSGDASAIPALRRAMEREGPLVRAHAAWALGRLGDGAWLAARRAVEDDPDVRAELDTAVAGG
ncbi:MAG TPA: tRNA epoxyqueuosine(34) reductase QueG [Haliangiales bacterium]|nr:tRNA epoxyqueuosine(34) reductase QueG [Haliangiales bacterium]